jgi:hypothetical protein
MRRKLHDTGLEIVTGKSVTSAEMAKTREGEATLMVLSFLTDALQSEVAAQVVRDIIDGMPDTLVQIRPRRAQVDNVITAIEGQTSCVSWQKDIIEAEMAVCEIPQVWDSGSVLPSSSWDIPTKCIAKFFQALCTVSRFPQDYRCVLQTSGSLVVPFVLAHSICGFRVCVLAEGEVIHGNASAGQWQVRLERTAEKSHVSRIKIGRKLEDVQEILMQEETGPVRANKIAVHGIGKAATLGQGLNDDEAWDMAVLAITVSISAFSQWEREVLYYGIDDDESNSDTYGATTSEQSQEPHVSGAEKGLVPLKVRLSAPAVALWWNCSTEVAIKLLREGEAAADIQPSNASWKQLRLGKESMGKIAEFEQMTETEQFQKRTRVNRALSRIDYSRLAHLLACQLSLICFLGFNDISKANIRVRSTSDPRNTVLGRALNCMKKPMAFGQTHAMSSWYQWIKGKPPRDLDRVEALSTEGFLIYRSLLFDISLNPDLCEMVTVEPGHLSFEEYRPQILMGYESGHMVTGPASYNKMLKGPARLRPKDETGAISVTWHVDESHGILESSLNLRLDRSGVQIMTSVYQVVEASWRILYGDRSIGCTHDEESVWSLLDGEEVEELNAGNFSSPDLVPSSWRAIKLYRSHDNAIGQVACLLSTDPEARGMVRRDACLRCCVSAANKMRLDFVID